MLRGNAPNEDEAEGFLPCPKLRMRLPIPTLTAVAIWSCNVTITLECSLLGLFPRVILACSRGGLPSSQTANRAAQNWSRVPGHNVESAQQHTDGRFAVG
ncbi:hypothetical protein COCC4DRAFT_34545 [Bipolaris maydis ATCC 48331]|uniref:Uncharacterized protein n=2 Tax=Cochliobolus heterostrophus TaxID=5016 RepID=M2U8Y8_COCH5|nr:uncharacterized protein COCC4DRAFT_34545 [Bipolaris maydis ATCC 48331]EMD95054.1 hypothetical protein COCHEDRAFT_1019919 [Bipolaris maydis C5]ENI00070.1 hypothetical protein COCC4DRAFT_34545 [Bipolaris maydis ATCC 48331]